MLLKKKESNKPPGKNGSLGSKKEIHHGAVLSLLGAVSGEGGKKEDHHRLLPRHGLVGAHIVDKDKRSKGKDKLNQKIKANPKTGTIIKKK